MSEGKTSREGNVRTPDSVSWWSHTMQLLWIICRAIKRQIAPVHVESTECLPVRLPPPPRPTWPGILLYQLRGAATPLIRRLARSSPTRPAARLEPSRSVAPNDFNDFISRLTSAVDRASCTLREPSVPAFAYWTGVKLATTNSRAPPSHRLSC